MEPTNNESDDVISDDAANHEDSDELTPDAAVGYHPLARHRLDPIALVAGVVTIAVGILGLLHQGDVVDLGPGAVAVIIAALLGVGILALVVLWPKHTTTIEDPRLARAQARRATQAPRR